MNDSTNVCPKSFHPMGVMPCCQQPPSPWTFGLWATADEVETHRTRSFPVFCCARDFSTRPRRCWDPARNDKGDMGCMEMQREMTGVAGCVGIRLEMIWLIPTALYRIIATMSGDDRSRRTRNPR